MNLQIPVEPLNQEAMAAAKRRWDGIATPLESLGKLEITVIRLAGIFGSEKVDVSKKCTIVMCADNGIVAEGVTQSGQEVTRVVAENMTQNRATISIMSRKAGADVLVVDIGMATDGDNKKIIDRKIMHGTNNFAKMPAMTQEQAESAVQVGIDLVRDAKDNGYRLLSTGEMGIGNTSTSSAITACILNKDVGFVTGRGAGLTSKALEKKIKLIEDAIKLHQPDPTDPIDVLAKVGGLDIAGLVGIFLGGAIYRIPVLIDGFISSVAALIAVRLCPLAKDFMFATHISNEPAGRMLIEELGLPHFFDLNMRLGEGTGAVLAFNIFDMAVAVYENMSDFAEANIEAYIPLV